MPGTTHNPQRGEAIEVHAFSFEGRSAVLPRLYAALAAAGCGLAGTARTLRHGVEYSFEVERTSAIDLYCSLMQAGLELTEAAHRSLTTLCTLRMFEDSDARPVPLVDVCLQVSFLETADENAGRQAMAS